MSLQNTQHHVSPGQHRLAAHRGSRACPAPRPLSGGGPELLLMEVGWPALCRDLHRACRPQRALPTTSLLCVL